MKPTCADLVREEAAKLGVVVERMVLNKHPKLYLRNAHGQQTVMVLSKSSSDYRAVRNALSFLRRFACLTAPKQTC